MNKPILIAVLFLFAFVNMNAQCTSGDCQDGKGIFLYPSGAKYVGEFQEGEIHGIGVCYYTDGSKYQGEWVHRYPEGRGTKTFADGVKRSGLWLKGQPVDENGELEDVAVAIKTSDEVDIQSGCISGDCKNGKGTFGYVNGSRYEGQFIKNQPDGWGAFYELSGEKYVGAFSGGVRHGNGTVYYTDGNKLTGEWKQGEFYGSSFIEKGQVGCVQGDCANGRGTYIYKNGEAKYTGEFKNNLPHGQGAVLYANGERYSGEFELGSFNGLGTLHMRDGRKVNGYWKDGTFMGKENPNPPVVEEEIVLIEKPKEEVEEYGYEEYEYEADEEEEVTDEYPDLEKIRESASTKVWAVIVGVASYDHMPTLRYTDDDAYRMYSFLKSPEGGALPDNQIRILIDEDATKVKIENSMEDIFSQAGSNDLVMLYFSGHGLKGSFIPIDFDGFNNRLEHEDVNAIFKKSPAKYKLCIADACHSGSLLAMKSANVGNVLSNYYTTLAQADPGTALILSSKSEETSLESSGLRQGVFSHFLIRGLKGEADEDENKVVTVAELYEFINSNVREYTGNRQSPEIKGDYDGKMTVSVIR